MNFQLIFAYIWGQLALASDLTSGCGTMEPCFRRPEGCVGSACDYSVAYCPRGDYVDFTVGVSIGDDVGPNFYLAFGVNETPERSDGSVVDCIHYGDTDYVRMSWNTGSKNYLVPETLSNATLDDSRSRCSYSGGFFECSFSRRTTVEVPIDPNAVRNPFIADLTLGNRYFIKIAKGNASSTTRKEYHGPNGRIVSPGKFDFGVLPTMTTTLENGAYTAVTLTDPATHHSGCGVTKGCYSIPNGCPEPSCQYNVEYTKRGDVIDFEVSAQIPPELGTDVYLCLGFNNQRKMAGAVVVDCISYDGDVNVQLSQNEDYTNVVIEDIHGVVSASEARGNVSDGYFTCAFSWKTTALGTVDSPDLANPEGHYLLMAVGPANSIRDKGDHGHNVHVSERRIDFSSTISREPTPHITFENCILSSAIALIVIRFFVKYGMGADE